MLAVPGFRQLEFDLSAALLSAVVETFASMDSAPLVSENLTQIPEGQGVYQLSLDGTVVYIGKTDAQMGLVARLNRHSFSIRDRQNLDPSQVAFKAVRVFVFTPMDLETTLIAYYRNPPWNNSGFGSNDPGRNRDRTEFKEGGFDTLYPIDIDRELNIDFPQQASAAEIAVRLKTALPYTFRYQTRAPGSRAIHPDFQTSQVTVPPGPNTARGIVRTIVQGLPLGWQATALPSRIILYKESQTYSFGEIIAATSLPTETAGS